MTSTTKQEMAFLEYSFLFDPREVGWPTIQDFERDMSAFFEAYGVEAQVLKTIEGQFGRRILYLKKVIEDQPELKTKLQPASKQMSNLVKKFGK